MIGDKDSEWEGWIWCTNSEGESRWVPEAFIERRGKYCLALRNYESTELSVQEGDILQINEVESGWAWCKNADGHSGWVPIASLDVYEERNSNEL